MSKIGNEARLIQKVVSERVERKTNAMLEMVTTVPTNKEFARGFIDGMRFVMKEFDFVGNDLERGI
jgi:hypothetical protein